MWVAMLQRSLVLLGMTLALASCNCPPGDNERCTRGGYVGGSGGAVLP